MKWMGYELRKGSMLIITLEGMTEGKKNKTNKEIENIIKYSLVLSMKQ